MYNTLIVSDMTDAINSFSRLGGFAQFNFTIIGQAKTRSELVSKSENEDISLYIVEEGFSGLSYQEIDDIIRKYNPNCEVIAISVSDSPIREKRVISLGAFAYLRRPLASGTFDIVLSGVENRLNRTNSSLSNSSSSINLSRLKNTVLKSLITNSIFIKNNEHLINDLKLNLNKENFFIIIIKSQHFEECMKLCLTYFSDNKISFECFSLERLCVAIVSEDKEKAEQVRTCVLSDLKLLIQKVSSADIASSYVFNDIYECSAAYAFTLSSFNSSLIDNRIFSFDKEKTDLYVSELIKTIKNGDEEMLSAKIIDTFSLSRGQLNAEEMTYVGVKTLENIFDLIDISNVEANSAFAKMSAFVCNSTFREELSSVLFIASKNAKKEKVSSSHNFANECYDYITSRFSDSSLSVKTLSDKMYISQNYLSTLMKKYYGDTFVNLLLKIRMDKAKELLQGTKKKVSTICAEVGYSDSHYFSYSFKKYYGVSPLEMREKGE